MRGFLARFGAMVVFLSSGALFGAGEAVAQVPPLSDVPVPRPPDLAEYVRDEAAAVVLGKALFWDMQIGGDGIQACATCHFRAGADPRKKNQISPGLLQVRFENGDAIPDRDTNFDGQGPNDTLRAEDFPFVRFADPFDRDSPFIHVSNTRRPTTSATAGATRSGTRPRSRSSTPSRTRSPRPTARSRSRASATSS